MENPALFYRLPAGSIDTPDRRSVWKQRDSEFKVMVPR
jgi:hypothetical protein